MKPLIFCNRSMLAWQQNAKTQTRRLAKPQPLERLAVMQLVEGVWFAAETPGDALFELKYQPYAVGQLLWIREALMPGEWGIHPRVVTYQSDNAPVLDGYGVGRWWHWKRDKLPAIFCPRWACRYYARVVSVRPERLQDISAADAIAEGALVGTKYSQAPECSGGKALSFHEEWWDSMHNKAGTRSEDNPLIWRYVLEPVDSPQGI